MTRRIKRSIALVVEGLGSSTASSAGVAWYYGHSTIETPGNYEWVGGRGSGQGLVDAPMSVGCMVDPFEVSIQGSGQQFKIHATDSAKALWLHRPVAPDDILSTEIDKDDTTLVFATNYTWSASDDGTAVWLRDECIKLGSWVSGGTFSGCTRGFWSTEGMLHPAGVNVWRYNPRRVNRLAKILLYDHDAGTATQAWQGFVSSIDVDGPVINVQCTDLLSSIRGAKVNRGNAKNLRYQITGTLSSDLQTLNGAVNMRDGTQGRRRVNKVNATSPHWVSLQVGDSVFYANWSGNTATFSDDTSYSSPQLGSIIDADDYGWNEPVAQVVDRVYELLVVDDRDAQTSGSLVAYANRRSSSRDLSKPLHPVMLTMALWTSGPDTTPGEAGTGAAGSSEDAPVGAYGLTQSQYDDAFFAWRAKADMVHEDASSEWNPPTVDAIANTDVVGRLLDASPSNWRCEGTTSGASPVWTTSPADSGNLNYSVDFQGGDHVRFPASKSYWRFLSDDTTDFTVLVEMSFDNDITANVGNEGICGTYTGATVGMAWLVNHTSHDMRVVWRNSGGSTSSVDYTTWSGFAQNTTYRLALRYTSGTTTAELFVAAYGAAMGAAVASGSITTMQATAISTQFAFGDRTDGAGEQVTGEYIGAAVLKSALTTTEMDAWFDWFEAGQTA